jgi:hypothetical protein
MRKVFMSLVLLSVLFSCKKENLDPADVYVPDIPALPSRFSQNVLIEQFTQSFNGQCPVADLILDSLVTSNADRIAAVNIHVLDQLSCTQLLDTNNALNLLDEAFNLTGTYPTGMSNRDITSVSDLNVMNYASRLNSTLSQVPRCGLAIDANDLNNGYLNLSVHVGFSDDLAGSYRLHVYLVENGFESPDSTYYQSNDFSQFGSVPTPGISLYDLPDPIFGYTFPYVLRRIITPPVEGETIPTASAKKGKDYIRSYILDFRNKIPTDYSIIAFVDKFGSTATSHRVENSRMVQVGKVSPWN